jgi:hypothetical protein
VNTCQAAIPAGPGVLVICGEPAISEWDYGCIHEHVVRKVTCAQHEPAAGKVGCYKCLAAGHDCEMTFRPVT